MTTTIFINGFGRIGRAVFRSVFEYGHDDIKIAGINDLADNNTLAHLLRYDSVHGRFNGTVEVVDGGFNVNGQFIQVTEERDPSKLPLDGVDIAMECTGYFTDREGGVKVVGRWRKEGSNFCTRQKRRQNNRIRRERGYVDRRRYNRFKRIMYHKLFGTCCQGFERFMRHQIGLHDNDPRLHR